MSILVSLLKRCERMVYFYVYPLAIGLACWLFSVPVLAAESCKEVFPNAVQSHNSQNGRILFSFQANISNVPDKRLPSKQVQSGWNRNSCGLRIKCEATGIAAEAINIESFLYTESSDTFYGNAFGSDVVGEDWTSNFARIDAGYFSTLKFSPKNDVYVIDELIVNDGAIVQLSAGDYWIGRLDLGANSRLEVMETGTVRLFIDQRLDIPFSSLINTPSNYEIGNSSKLLIWVNDEIRLRGLSVVSAILYAKRNITLGLGSRLNGVASANNVRLDIAANVHYPEAGIDFSHFEDVCTARFRFDDLDGDGIADGLDDDIDGDGVSNQLEALAGSDPRDPTSVPQDDNNNGIPDSIEVYTSNQCLAAFANGLQTHSNQGNIRFDHNARLVSGSSHFVRTERIDSNFHSLSTTCDSVACEAVGIPASGLTVGEFKFSEGTESFSVTPRSVGTVYSSDSNQWDEIRVGVNGQLDFEPQDEYRIKRLLVRSGSKVNLSPGDYWIEDLRVQAFAQLNVAGEGTVRLFVNQKLNVSLLSQFNTDGQNYLRPPDKLILTTFGDISTSSFVMFSGYIYSLGKVNIGYRSEFLGGINASSVRLRVDAQVVYDHSNLSKADFGFICDADNDGTYDGLDDDIDGDGISNDFEERVGTDPYDANDTPPDLDSDGIPNSLDDDRDGDGSDNINDAFPDDKAEWLDTDGDGIGNNSDPDRDGDGISNDLEQQLGFDPDDSTNTPPDLDKDGTPDELDDDIDGDTYVNEKDVFPRDGKEWSDLDKDGIGDNSDTDRDGDGIRNSHEQELGFDPNNPSSTPPDMDGDKIPDALDPDRDGDGVNNGQDAFPNNKLEWADLDKDGIGNNSDPDRDGDGISNDMEVQLGFDPNNPTSTPPDLDGDKTPDALDADIDGDNRNNDADAFPYDSNEWSDLDKDGIGDNGDSDRDGDGIGNEDETKLGFDPSNANSTPPDMDGDGIPDSLDDDRDGDGHKNDSDRFPDDSKEWADLDSDGIGDNSDSDRDGDGVSNENEIRAKTDPDDADSTPPDLDKDGIPDLFDDDKDGDGVKNEEDAFPEDAAESSDMDSDGVGDNSDPDRDGDGISNEDEEKLGFDPNDATKTPPDLDKDGLPDQLDDDIDGDGVKNTEDKFPEDSTESKDLDSDGIGDNSDPDRDGDGINNEDEIQLGFNPDDANSSPPDLDSDGKPDALDEDIDGDNISNSDDIFPNDGNEWADLDGDGTGDNSDPDRDGDGVTNEDEINAGTDPGDPQSVPDNIPPEVTFSDDLQNSTDQSSILLKGEAIDRESGLAGLQAKSDRFQGISFSVTLEGDVWQSEIPLEMGENLITIEARDKKGNPSSIQVIVSRQLANQLFDLVIETPAPNSLLDSDTVTLRGYLISEARVESPQVKVNNEPAEVSPTTEPTRFTFVSQPLVLAEGNNIIQVTASINEIELQRILPLVYQTEQTTFPAPSINIISPTPGRYLQDQSFSLLGEVTSYVGEASLKLNEVPVSLQGGERNQANFSELFSFEPDQTEITIILEATDAKGQVTKESITYHPR